MGESIENETQFSQNSNHLPLHDFITGRKHFMLFYDIYNNLLKNERLPRKATAKTKIKPSYIPLEVNLHKYTNNI